MATGKKSLLCPLSNATLTTRFAVYSFICVAIMTAALWFIVSHYLINQILKREWKMTADIVRLEAKQYLTKEDFKAKDPNAVGQKFDELFRHITLMPDIVRFKVYNPQTVVVWSDDKRLVGQSFPDNDELREALRGEIVADMSSLTKRENVFEHDSIRRAVEVYTPIYSDASGELLGVIEIYKNATAIYRDINEARLLVLLGALGGGLLLYLSLFAIVRQAAQKISEQQKNLFAVQSELVASQRMAAVGEMAAAVAHGIGNPLSSIRAVAQMGKLDCTQAKACANQKKTEAALQNIIEQVDRVQKRMHSLLNFVKPMEPRAAMVDINTLISDIIGLLAPRFVEAGVVPQLDLERTLPQLWVDANHVEQVFMGLITNALEATPRGGRVSISTRGQKYRGSPAMAIVSVEDTGAGIPSEIRQRVFEPFFTTKAHGTGIGLPLAKRFVERNGGKITVSSGAGGGGKFEVAFPLAAT